MGDVKNLSLPPLFKDFFFNLTLMSSSTPLSDEQSFWLVHKFGCLWKSVLFPLNVGGLMSLVLWRCVCVFGYLLLKMLISCPDVEKWLHSFLVYGKDNNSWGLCWWHQPCFLIGGVNQTTVNDPFMWVCWGFWPLQSSLCSLWKPSCFLLCPLHCSVEFCHESFFFFDSSSAWTLPSWPTVNISQPDAG